MTNYWTRTINVADKPLINEWIAADDDHRGKMDSGFFFQPGTVSFAMGSWSNVGLFIRIDPMKDCTALLHIQFSPYPVISGKTMLGNWYQFIWGLERAGVKRIMFESTSPSLIGFCKRCFHFAPVEGSNSFDLQIGVCDEGMERCESSVAG